MDQVKKIRNTIEKFDIKLKSKPKDGVILQLHHTIRSSNGDSRRIRFNTGTFDDSQDKLACADNGGNLFILDFTDHKFWKLTNVGSCSALQFIPEKVDVLVVAIVKTLKISFMDVETGDITVTLVGHTAPVKNIAFSTSKVCNLLTASPAEAILWELKNYTKYFTLNTYLGAQIQQIIFTPSSEYLVACFQNDTVQIWKHESMKSVKQIIPSDLKHMKSIAFTMNGRAMVMAGLTPIMIIFSMDTWQALKSINLTKYNMTGVQEVAFIPQIFDGGANKILALLSSDCVVYLFDIESQVVIHKISPESSKIRKLVVSPSGKHFFCILQLGEVNIYNSSYVLDMNVNCTGDQVKNDTPSTSHQANAVQDIVTKDTLIKSDIEHKMRICMDSARLRRILMQYGEYPEKFRSVIWRSLLNTPKNKNAYVSLLDKGIHSSYKDIEKLFTIHSSVTLKNMKRLLSCLSHWCPLFAVIKFLPGFVFPFVKVLQKDPLLLFECVASILINYCQLWFEYAPFPPISVLSMIENIIAEHDHHLLEHFCNKGVTSQTYALKIMETAFSEVLSCSEWLILWDHILSNEPAFILMAVASYSIVQRNALRKLKTPSEFDNFYHMQNPINKKHFLKKAYVLLNETSEDIHPRKFFNIFVSLEKGLCYQQFSGYPKATICMKLADKEKETKKMLSKENKKTLKELTVQSQEHQIKEREVIAKQIRSDNETARKHLKTVKKGSSSRTGSGGQIGDASSLQCEDAPVCETCKNPTSVNSNTQNKTLEKEVEKLIRTCSDTDISEFY